MGLIDSFSAEDRVDVKFTDFTTFMKATAQNQLLVNAINTDVPHKYIRRMLTGTKEEEKNVN